MAERSVVYTDEHDINSAVPGSFEFVHNGRARGERILGALIGQSPAQRRNPS